LKFFSVLLMSAETKTTVVISAMAENSNICLPVLEPAGPYQEPCWVCGYRTSGVRATTENPLSGDYQKFRRQFCSYMVRGLMDRHDSYLLVCPTCFAIIGGMSKHIVERQLRRPWAMRGGQLPTHFCNEVNALPNVYDPSPPSPQRARSISRSPSPVSSPEH